MKKIIITIFAFMFASYVSIGVTFASSNFNQLPTCTGNQQVNCDLPTVMVTNTQCSSGPGAGCWSTSTTAQPGGYVWVQIYYHNTSGSSVPNVALRLNNLQNSGASTSFSTNGGVVSDAQGSASINTSSAQTLTLVGVQLNGQYVLNQNDLFTGAGLAIGSVGVNQQGGLVAKYQVSNNNTGGGGSCVINSFTANGSSSTTINQGGSASLAWNTTDCTSVNISNVGSVGLDNSGYSVSPSYTTTYTLTAYGANSSQQTRSVTVNVTPIVVNYCDVTFTSDQYSINSGSGTYLRWTSSGSISSVSISPNVGNQGTTGSVYITPTATTTYNLTAYGCSTSYYRTATVNVNSVVNPPVLNLAPQAITTVATVLSSSQARLNGIAVPNVSYGTTNAWFEWGTTGSLGSRTISQTIPANSTSNYYNNTLSGLTSGRAYYYRAAVQNQNGTAYGDIVRFQTLNRVTPPVVVQPPRVIVRQTTNTVTAQSVPSLLELKVVSNYDTMCVGGTINYTISYTNISNQTLQNAVLQFNNPKEITFISASRGNYEVIDRTLTIPLGNLNPGESGSITVNAAVNGEAVRGNLTVTTATVVYTNSITRAQEDAIAYSLITVSDTCPNNLGASVLGFGSFLPNTLLGWLILILVILALIVLGRNLYKRNEKQEVITRI